MDNRSIFYREICLFHKDDFQIIIHTSLGGSSSRSPEIQVLSFAAWCAAREQPVNILHKKFTRWLYGSSFARSQLTLKPHYGRCYTCTQKRLLAQVGYGLSNIDTSELESIVKGYALSRISKEVCGRSANTLNSDLLSRSLCPDFKSSCLPLSTFRPLFTCLSSPDVYWKLLCHDGLRFRSTKEIKETRKTSFGLPWIEVRRFTYRNYPFARDLEVEGRPVKCSHWGQDKLGQNPAYPEHIHHFQQGTVS